MRLDSTSSPETECTGDEEEEGKLSVASDPKAVLGPTDMIQMTKGRKKSQDRFPTSWVGR